MSAMVVGAAVCGIVAWLTIAVTLGLDFAGRGLRRRRPGFRWTGLGGLVMMSGVLVLLFATARNWPFSQKHAIAAVMFTAAVPVVVCMLAGYALDIRAREAKRSGAASRSAE